MTHTPTRRNRLVDFGLLGGVFLLYLEKILRQQGWPMWLTALALAPLILLWLPLVILSLLLYPLGL